MLRFAITELGEHGGGPLPPIDLADEVVVIGSGPAARIRLPARIAQPEHVRLAGGEFALIGAATIGGAVRAAGERGAIGDELVIELGGYQIRVSPAPDGAQPASRQRTESLARELVRGLLGEGAAPSLAIERGPHAGARRALPPPEARLVIGRGDDAGWVIVDEDLSRAHAELRVGWDGVTVVDLGSKNGTRVDGVALGAAPVALRDGASLALGGIVMRFHDPAERHLRGEPPVAPRVASGAAPPPAVAPPGAGAFYGFAAIAVLALAALIWVLVS